jgi:hypothetical protein
MLNHRAKRTFFKACIRIDDKHGISTRTRDTDVGCGSKPKVSMSTDDQNVREMFLYQHYSLIHRTVVNDDNVKRKRNIQT